MRVRLFLKRMRFWLQCRSGQPSVASACRVSARRFFCTYVSNTYLQWYTNTNSRVRICGRYSAPYTLHRGVRQGSVLSPFLFLLVMDPILLQLSSKSCGLSITGLYLGAFSHADDVRTLSTSIADARDQINQVENFASSILNANKCEAIVSPSTPASLTSIDVDGLSIPINNSAICLGSWWTPAFHVKNGQH